MFGGGVGSVHRKAVPFERGAVPRRPVGDQTPGFALHHPQEFDVAADGTVLPTHRVDDQDLFGAA